VCGLILLLPGACAVIFMPFTIAYIASDPPSGSRAWWDAAPVLMALAALWAGCFAISWLGLKTIAKSQSN
jgi:hypothetical protein